MRHLAPLILLAMTACGPTDADGDGVPASMDCDDADVAVFPGANEVCDGKDNDCNGVTDDDYARGGQIFFLDRDGDGFGVWEQARVQCAAPVGYVSNPDDCADDDATVYPGAPEFCDRIDQDCDNAVDEDAVDAVAYYTDFDQDGYGGLDQVRFECEQPEGFITVGGDCDDFESLINPQAVERCDLIDNNCNGIVDEGASVDATIWYADKDRDGFADPDDTVASCYQPEYYYPPDLATDCNDADDAVNPGAREECYDGIDNDCDGSGNQCDFGNWTSEDDAVAEWTGPNNFADMGEDVDFVGDVNGDGFDDMIFGARDMRASGVCVTSFGYCGGAVLVFGGEGLEGSFTASDGVMFSASNTYDYLGDTVDAAGDLDGDGFADLAMGAYSHDYNGSGSGAVFIVYGGEDYAPGSVLDVDANLPLLFGEESFDDLGYAVGGVGDIDGDGFDDLLMGATDGDNPSGDDTGVVYVLPGSRERVVFQGVDSLPGFYGEARFDDYGRGFGGNAFAGDDFDGDGFQDHVSAAIYHDPRGRSSAGRVYMVYGEGTRPSGRANIGEVADATISGEDTFEYAGSTLASVGDVNGDGYPELLVGSYGYNSYRGLCSIFFGGAERLDGDMALSSGDITVQGPSNSVYMCGFGGTGADLDRDGFSDLVLGAQGADQSTSGSTIFNNGLVLLYAGGPDLAGELSLDDATGVMRHGTSGANFGEAFPTRRGDVNGDGYDDMVVSAPGTNSSAGSAYLYLGVGL
jgi:hypothetical protein